VKFRLALVFGIAVISASGVAIADDAETSADLVTNLCSNCHGKDGKGVSPTFPNLAAQKEEYIAAQIKAFRDRTRADPHAQAYMWGMASNPQLTDGVIEEVAKYYAKQTPAPATPAEDAALSEKGKALYMNGDEARAIPVCSQCHGLKAEGNAMFPRLASQKKEYLARQLRAFQKNTRENPLMHENATNLTDGDIEALTTFLASQ
jgi:cytochrome c553